jgi:hypothetical protein
MSLTGQLVGPVWHAAIGAVSWIRFIHFDYDFLRF